MDSLLNTCTYQIFKNVASGKWIPKKNIIRHIPSELIAKIFSLLLKIPKSEYHKYFNTRTFSFFYGGSPESLDDRFWKSPAIQVLTHCQSLKKIKLIFEEHIAHLHTILEKCTGLEKLILPHHCTLEGEILRWAAHFPNLTTFKGCFRDGKNVRLLLDKCTNITSLHIKTAICEGFTDKDVNFILNGTPLLKLHLETSIQVTDTGFLTLTKHQSHLNKLAIHGKCKLSNSWISSLLYFSRLTCLNLQGCEIDANSQQYINTITALKTLKLNAVKLRGGFIATLIQKNHSLVYCQLIMQDNSGIAPLKAALQCPHLKLLEFVENTATIKANDVSQFSISRLKVLKIQIHTNTGLSALISKLTSLKSFTFQADSNLDTELASSIAKCRELQSLVVDHFPFIPAEKFFMPNIMRFEIISGDFEGTTILHRMQQTCPLVSEVKCEIKYLHYEATIACAISEFQNSRIYLRLISRTPFGMLEKNLNSLHLATFDLHHQIEKTIKNSLK